MFQTFASIGVLSLTAAISPAFAQDSVPVRVNVPFTFVFAGETLPAGSYSVATSDTSGVVTIKGEGVGYMALSGPSEPYNGALKPSLRFEKEADGEHLVGVNLSGTPRIIGTKVIARGKIAALAAVTVK